MNLLSPEQIFKLANQSIKENANVVENLANVNNTVGIQNGNAGLIQWVVIAMIIAFIAFVFVMMWQISKLIKNIQILSDAINEEKKLTLKNWKKLAPEIADKFFFKLDKRISLIVSRNSLSQNMPQIKPELRTITTEMFNSLINKIHEQEFDVNLNGFISELKIFEEDFIVEIQDHFENTSTNLKKLEKHYSKRRVIKCEGQHLERIEELECIKNEFVKEYEVLNREKWRVFEDYLLKTKMLIEEVT